MLPLLLLLAPGCVESGVTVHNTLPEVVITAPLTGASFLEREPFTLQAYVRDAETPNHQLLYVWTLSPEGNLDGTQTIDDNGLTLELESGLAPGTWIVLLTVVDPRGGATSAELTLFVSENSSPTTTLLSPTSDEQVYEEDSLEVLLEVTDDEDPADLLLTWSGPPEDLLEGAPSHPDSDGQARFYLIGLEPGDIQLSVTATDRLGLTDTATVLFGVFTGDQDGDGYVDILYGGDDCDDTRDDVYPGAPELEDGVDNDCDDLLDNTGTWQTTVIDSSGDAGHLLQLCLDDADTPLLAWSEHETGLVLGTPGDFGWTTEVIASGELSSLEARWLDGLHLLWTDDTTATLAYGVHDGANLSSTPVDDDLSASDLDYPEQGHGTFVLDSTRTAHAAWADGEARTVAYAWGDLDGFDSEPVWDRIADALAIALDPVGGGLGVAIRDSENEELLFAYRDLDGTWSSSVIDNNTEPGFQVRLVFDNTGTPHALWWDDSLNAIRYGWWSGLSWILSDLQNGDTSSDLSEIRGLALAVDETDQLHAAWAWSFEQSAETTLYTASYALEAGDWTLTDLTADGDAPTDLDLDLDSNQDPHMAWRDGETSDVVYRFRY